MRGSLSRKTSNGFRRIWPSDAAGRDRVLTCATASRRERMVIFKPAARSVATEAGKLSVPMRDGLRFRYRALRARLLEREDFPSATLRRSSRM